MIFMHYCHFLSITCPQHVVTVEGEGVDTMCVPSQCANEFLLASSMAVDIPDLDRPAR
jgi:hypothetical protein